MIPFLTNHLWQSTLFVFAAGAVAFALRKNGAHIRHRIWVIASLKFLVPFSVLMSLGGALQTLTPAAGAITTPSARDLSLVIDQIAQPFASEVLVSSVPAAASATTNWTVIIFAGVWACGFLVVVVMRLRGWRRIRAAMRASVPVPIEVPVPVRASGGLLEPGVVGLFRPVLLVPAGIEHTLTSKQLDAVLAHELCHVRRRDNLTSAIHMVVEALFWFHPLVWFVGARLIDERERACDEHVLRVCGDPQVYAESILNVCKAYVESPLACVSGVGGSDLRKRVAAILVNHVGLQLSLVRKVTLAIAALLVIALPLVAGMLIASASAFAAAQSAAATADKSRKFDVASVKPCEGDMRPPAGERPRGGTPPSPGYLSLPCLTLRALVGIAYAGLGLGSDPGSRLLNDRFVPDFQRVRGGPSWVASETFAIEAKADGVTDRNTLTGPMLRALLEDRFQLKVHRATEERPIYTLTVAKSGLKITPLPPGACYEFDPWKPVLPPDANNRTPCGGMQTGPGNGSYKYVATMLGNSAALEGTRFEDNLSRFMSRPVIDRTGLNGRYSFSLEFTPDDTTPGVNTRGRAAGPGLAAEPAPPPPVDAPTIFKALDALGLKLEPTKGPVEYLVIDRVERLKPDAPSAIVDRPSSPASLSERRPGGRP